MNDKVLSSEDIELILPELHVAWSDIPGQGLVRVFDTTSYAEGLGLVAKIGSIADQHKQAPQICLCADEVEVTLFTEDAGGVTQGDIDFARAIDAAIA